jgi:hypothetical protein
MLVGDSTATVFGTQFTLSALSVALIQYAKNSDSKYFKWINKQSDKVNHFVSLALSFVNAIGVHWAWSHGTAAGAYTLSFTGLTLSGIGTGIWNVTKVFVLNETIYRATVKAAADTSVKVSTTGTAVMEVNKPSTIAK